MILLFSLLVAASLARQDPLKAVLRSPRQTLREYGRYKAARHLTFGPSEDRMRLGVWKRSAEMVADENSRAGHTAELELNFFAIMTKEERQQYLGKLVTILSLHQSPEINTLAEICFLFHQQQYLGNLINKFSDYSDKFCNQSFGY